MERRTQQARRCYALTRGVFAGMRSAWHSACGVRWAWRITAGLCHAFLVLPLQRNPCTDCKSAQQCTTRNSAQLGGIPYHVPKLHPGPCNSVGMRPLTDRHTDRQTHTRVIISRRVRLTRNVINYMPLLRSRRTSPHFGWYSFLVQLRVGG